MNASDMNASSMNTHELQEQVALVTGGAGGIGAAVVEAFEARGARCVVADTKAGASSDAWIETDVTDDASVAHAVSTCVERHGRLDALVHAAGVTRDAVLWKLPLEHWDTVLAVNLRGAFLSMRHAVPHMRRLGGGSIVLIGSINGSRGKFGLTAYSASKAGLIGLAKSAAHEVARFGVRVNVVEPGMVRTPMTENLSDDVKREAERETLLGRLGEPEDIAAATLFLCGSGARHITGQILRVDGGQYL